MLHKTRRNTLLLLLALLSVIGLTLALSVTTADAQDGDEQPLQTDGDPDQPFATVFAPQGLSLVGWFGAPTTSTAILAGDPSIERIWWFDANGQTWIVDSTDLPISLRPEIRIRRGTGFFLSASESTQLRVPLDAAGVLADAIFPGAAFVSSSRLTNGAGEEFVTTEWSIEAETEAILSFYEQAFANLGLPGQVFRGLTGPDDLPVVTLALQDVSFAANAVVVEEGAPGGVTLVRLTINQQPPGR